MINNKKIILLVGRTGRGKSTLANVLTNRREVKREIISKELLEKKVECYKCEQEFVEREDIKLIVAIIDEKETYYYFHEECFNFKESMGSISETRNIQSEIFEKDSINYLIVDTPGIGDTKLSTEEILDIIAEAVCLSKDGVDQIFFVIDGRFDQYEMATYKILKGAVFDRDIAKYTTIVRTRFNEFREKKKCEDDIKSMIEEGGELAEIIESCQKKVVHVDNPSLEIKDAREGEIKLRRLKRDKSRKILLEHLNKDCQKVPYKPLKLEKLSDDIIDFMEKKIELREKLKLKRLKILEKCLGLERLVESFSKKVVIENGNYEEVKSDIEKLCQELKNKDFPKEGIEKIICRCERLVDLWQQINNSEESELMEIDQEEVRFEISPK